MLAEDSGKDTHPLPSKCVSGLLLRFIKTIARVLSPHTI